MSRKIRIGNNIEVQWTVNLHKSDGTLVDLTSLNLGVQLCVGSKVFEVSDPTIAANLVTFLFPGSEQKYDGPYVVKLYDKDNTTITYDVRNAFILVDHSWGADSVYTPDDVTVEIETDINAVQIIAIAGPKGDKGDKGDTGSKGDTGENGADGANGYDGIDGKDGADGKDGKDGRNGVDGKDGEPGRSIRKSVFEVGKMYYNGEVLSDDGVYYLDIVTDTAVAMADEEVNYYVCKETHLSTANEDLDDTTLWTPMSNTGPIVTPLVLAEKIKAGFIDVDELYVKHLQGATGDFSGEITAQSGNIKGVLNIDGSGQIKSSHTTGEMWRTNTVDITSEHVKCHTQNQASASVSYTSIMTGSEIQVSNQYGVKCSLNSTTVTRDNLNGSDTTEYALFVNENTRLKIVPSLPEPPEPYTLYIVTDATNHGVYYGSQQIA